MITNIPISTNISTKMRIMTIDLVIESVAAAAVAKIAAEAEGTDIPCSPVGQCGADGIGFLGCFISLIARIKLW